MKIFLSRCLCVCCLLSTAAYAQQANLDSLEKALILATEDSIKVELLNKLSTQYAAIDPLKAENLGDNALKLAIHIQDLRGQSKAYYALGIAAFYQGRLADAIVQANASLRLAKRLDWTQQIINSLNLMGPIYFYQGQYQSGEEHLQQSIDLGFEMGDSLGIARAYMNLGSLYVQRGDFDKALENYLLGKELFQLLGNEEYLFKLLLNFGSLYMEQGNIEKALDNYLELLPILEDTVASIEVATVYAALGTVYQDQKAHEQAIYYLKKTIEVSEIIGDLRSVSGYSLNLAQIYFELDSLDQIERLLQRALEIGLEIQENRIIVQAYDMLGVLHKDLERYQEALEFFDLALERANKVEEPSLLAAIYNHIAVIFDKQEDYEQALKWFRKSLAIWKEENYPSFLGICFFNIGRAHYWLGEYEMALEALQESIKIFESIYETFAGENSKQKSLQEGQDSYEKAFAASLFLDRIPEAFQYSEKLKSRILNDLLIEAEIDITPSQELALERKEIAEGFRKVNQALQEELSDSLRTKLLNEKHLLTSQLKIFQAKVRKLEPVVGNLIYPKLATLFEIQSILPKDEVLIEYVAQHDITAAIILTHDSYQAVVLDTNWQVSRAIREFRQSYLEESRRAIDNDNFQENADWAFFEKSSRLYELLFEPLEETGLLKGKDLIIIPDRKLNYLPFELLIKDQKRKQYESYAYLIHDYRIRYFPSATTFFRQQTKNSAAKKHSKQLLAVGDPIFQTSRTAIAEHPLQEEQGIRDALQPLVHSEREVKGIASLFPKKEVEVLTQQHATEDTLKALDLTAYRYLHFSTHGIINSEYPDWSAIALTQDDDPQEDGLLQMYEMFDLELNADLVTLSACETALGKLVEGEGMVGFTRSLMYAGTPSLVLSLWSVADESTADLFLDYYRHLNRTKGKDKQAPLRKAQLRMIRKGGRFANPFYWAPFIFIGEK